MRATYFKRTICAALAGLMLAMTACGEVADEPSKGTNSSNSASGSGEAGGTSVSDENGDPDSSNSTKEDIPDNGIAISLEPLSAADLGLPGSEPNEGFYDAYRSFAAEMFSQVCAEDLRNGENAMVSPESVMMALGMTANGADGETLTQMETALGGLDIDTLNSAMLYLTNRAKDAEGVDLNIANSVWVRDDADRIQMKQDFCDKVKSLYDADSFLAPFDRTTCADINGWVSNETKGMIPQILDDIPPEAVAYLVNAMAFEGEWEEPYEDPQVVEEDIFTNSKGEEEKATMLYSTESIYLQDENTKGFLKFYKSHYAFMALLPEEGTDIGDYVSSLDGGKLTGLWESRKGGCEVYTSIPEFTSDYDNELSGALQAMGMELPFTGGADFSRMADTDSGALYISRVLHKTHIEVDRTGTKAAAATALEMTDECAMLVEDVYDVYLDRPFVYAIVDSMNGMPIFIGAVNTVG